MAKKSKESKETREKRIRKSPQYVKMKSALSPLFENLNDESSSPYLFVKKNCEAVTSAFKYVKEIQLLVMDLTEITSLETTTLKVCSLLDLYCYLALVESVATTYIDIVLLLLIAEGHDLHIERRFVRHVSCFEDLTKVDLWTKLEFLEEHNLKLVSRIFDRKLRNRIAHLDFNIDTDGTIKTGRGAKIDIDKKTVLLIKNLMTLGQVVVDLGLDKFLNKMVKARREESKK